MCAASIAIKGDLRQEQGIESLVDGAVPPYCLFEPLVEVAAYPGSAVVAERAVFVLVFEEELPRRRVRERGQVERLLEPRRRVVRSIVRGRSDRVAQSRLVSTRTALSLPPRFSHRELFESTSESRVSLRHTHAQTLKEQRKQGHRR